MALLCAPFNVGGDVYTVIGNARSEKSVYSILSLYQVAGHDAVTAFGLAGYQAAGHDAGTTFGLAGYQAAGHDAVTAVGLAGYQAGMSTQVYVGAALYQRAGSATRAFGAFSKLAAPEEKEEKKEE